MSLPSDHKPRGCELDLGGQGGMYTNACDEDKRLLDGGSGRQPDALDHAIQSWCDERHLHKSVADMTTLLQTLMPLGTPVPRRSPNGAQSRLTDSLKQDIWRVDITERYRTSLRHTLYRAPSRIGAGGTTFRPNPILERPCRIALLNDPLGQLWSMSCIIWPNVARIRPKFGGQSRLGAGACGPTGVWGGRVGGA